MVSRAIQKVTQRFLLEESLFRNQVLNCLSSTSTVWSANSSGVIACGNLARETCQSPAIIKAPLAGDPVCYKPFVEEGEGFKDTDLLLSHTIAKLLKPKLLQTLEEMTIDGKTTFTICDYAAADGLTSMDNIREIIGWIRRKHSESIPIQLIYEDLPFNDFKSLIRRVHGLLPGGDPGFGDVENLYVLISPTGFFSKCVPPNTVNLGFSTLSMHYLNELPCKITGAIHSKLITIPEEEELFKAQAAKDWENLLLKRASEMKPGGRFVLEALATDSDGHYSGTPHRINFFRHLDTLWRRMASDGIISQDEFANTNSLHYLRTLEEYTAPFEDTSSAVYRAGLRLCSAEIYHLPCPHHQSWVTYGRQGDPQAMRSHAHTFTKSIRYFTNWLFMGGLSTHRTAAECQQIVDEFYNRFEDDVAAAPADFGFTNVGVFISFRKV